MKNNIYLFILWLHDLRLFYLRPSYNFKRLGSVRNFSQIKGYFCHFLGFLKHYSLPKQRQTS